MFEALKGLYQVNPDGDPTQWTTGCDFPAATDRQEPSGSPKGMSGLVFTRRPIFADKAVRRALAKLFDFG